MSHVSLFRFAAFWPYRGSKTAHDRRAETPPATPIRVSKKHDYSLGPTVSWCWEMGTTRLRDVRPTVGLMPTRLLTSDGERIEPSVSVPRHARASPSELATPLPEEEPEGSWRG